jgi:hypothetical protein
MLLIFTSQSVGGLSFSIWENSSGQFIASVDGPDCKWQSKPVVTIAEAERLAREAVTNELALVSQTIAEIAAAVLAA